MEVSGVVSSVLDPSTAIPAPAIPAEAIPADRWAGTRDPMPWIYLGLALGIGLLRFVALSRWSLWLDEALTLADSNGNRGWANPFGYWLFDLFYGHGPERPDEFAMRFPAALFGWASILATFWAFAPLLGRRAAALAALFLAVSVWQLYWSQNARFYTLAQLLGVLGGGALLRGLYGGSAWRTALGLLALVLSALTHPSAAFLIAPLLVLPWVARWLDWIPDAALRSRSWSLFSNAGLVALVVGSGWALRAWLRWEARQGAGSPQHFAKTTGYLLTPTVALACLIGVLRGWRAPERFVPVLTTALGLGGAALASLFVRVSAQYVFVLQPWIAACAALALVSLARPGRRSREALLVLLVAAPGLVESALYFTLRNGDRPRWREAYAYVFEHRGPADLVLGMDAPVAEYYLNPRSRELRAWSEATWLDDFRSRLPLDWARYGRRTWFVINAVQLDDWSTQPSSMLYRAELLRILREDCEVVASFEVPFTPRDLDVQVYVTRSTLGP